MISIFRNVSELVRTEQFRSTMSADPCNGVSCPLFLSLFYLGGGLVVLELLDVQVLDDIYQKTKVRQVFSKHENRVGENIEDGSCLIKIKTTTHPS